MVQSRLQSSAAARLRANSASPFWLLQQEHKFVILPCFGGQGQSRAWLSGLADQPVRVALAAVFLQ